MPEFSLCNPRVNKEMTPVELNIFAGRMSSVCEEMGAVLRNTAFSPNIRDRLDFSCAIFDADGELCAQAAHLPVHLGSMAFAMRDVVTGLGWGEGDMLILNNPYLGGTHLPDVTLIAPVFVEGGLVAFVVNRAHHADIGADSPGSMPLSSHLDEEGLVISPVKLIKDGRIDEGVMASIIAGNKNPQVSRGDFLSQMSANTTGVRRLTELVTGMGMQAFSQGLTDLNSYAERLARSALVDIPDGEYTFEDLMDDDGQGGLDIPIRLSLKVDGASIVADFAGTAGQVRGNINCPLSVAAAGVYYVFRCLMPVQMPACAGAFRSIDVIAPPGSLLNARYPAAVAAGNVETSSRVVDVVLGALLQAIPDRICAAAHGGMNNLAMGDNRAGRHWDYYETIGGGMGAGVQGDGLSAVQTHMTNTLNTPVEVMETAYPVRIRRYGLRTESGGSGRNRGGDGVVREYEFLDRARVTLLTERRRNSPWGAAGGQPGCPGSNRLNGEQLLGKATFEVETGDCLTIETPGGGGFGEKDGIQGNK